MHHLIEKRKNDFAAIIERLKKELHGLRTGRATPTLVENILVEAYGVKTPLQQLASLSVPDAKTLLIQPWDKNVLKDIERGIVAANLGFAPVVDGERVRLTMPPLTEETRKQLIKVLKEKIEAHRHALRGLRDQIRDVIVAEEKAARLSEDERYRTQKELDTYTQEVQKQLVSIVEQKEKEIMTV